MGVTNKQLTVALDQLVKFAYGVTDNWRLFGWYPTPNVTLEQLKKGRLDVSVKLNTSETQWLREEILRLLNAVVKTKPYLGKAVTYQHVAVRNQRDGKMTPEVQVGRSYRSASVTAFDDMIEVVRLAGVEKLRICGDPKCGKLFVKVGRKEYCSTRCQMRVYMRTQRG